MTKVINIKSGKPYDVYIGRPSKWGNPFHIGIDGNRAQVIEKFRNYANNSETIKADIGELEGKVLGCYCKPEACHGDVLIEILEESI